MEAKLVKDLMEAYASVYAQPEEVIAESDCECEDEEKSEKETPEMNGKKKGKKEKEDEDEMKEGYISEDPVQDYRDMKRAKENAAGMRGSELSHSTNSTGGGSAKQKPQKPEPRSREFSHGGSSQPRSREFAREEVETDLFDIILEYLVAEGYADTNQSALVIMANMSEDWRQNIVETIAGGGYTPNPVGNAIRTGAGLLQKAMSNPSVQGAIKTGSEMLKKKAPTGGYSTRPGDGKPYADGPLWGPGSGDAPKQPQRKPQAPMRDEPLW